MPDPDPKPPQLQRFRELKGLVSLYEGVFEKLHPPDATFERRSGEIRTRIDETWAQLSTARPEDVSKFQERIVELSGSLKEIELGHNRQKERYEARLWKHYNALRDSVMKVLVERPEATPGTTAKDGDPVIRKPSKKLSLSSKPSLSSPPKPSSPCRTPTTAPGTHPLGKRKDSSSSLLTPEKKRHKPEKTPRRHPRGSHTDQQDYQCITHPEPGKVYLAFWESSKQWVPVLLLPMTDLERVGVSGSLDSLDLAEILPICYDQDSLTGERTWRDGYKDGQPLVTEREFPVIYFEGRAFPEQSPVGWVAAKDLRKFDVATANSHLVPQIQMVRKFLKERAANVSCDDAEETSHEKDVSDDQPPQETSTVLNQDEQPVRDPPAPETATAPEASTNGTQPTPGPTTESQPTPHTSATRQKSSPDTTTESGPKERSTSKAQSKPTEAQPLPRQKTPLRKAVLVMADLTPSPDATPVSESERPQDTITAMELDPTPQKLAGNANLAPEAVMALDEKIPTDESLGRTIKVEPDLDIPRNIDISRDIEIISIASTEPEDEEEDNEVAAVPEFTNTIIETGGLPGPSKQPGAVEESIAKEGRPPHHDNSQSNAPSESLPGKAGIDSSRASVQAQETRHSSRPTGPIPRTASNRAAGPDRARQNGLRCETLPSVVPCTPMGGQAGLVVSDSTGRNMHAILVNPSFSHLPGHHQAQNPRSNPSADSPAHTSPHNSTLHPPGAKSQPVAQTPSAGRDRGSTHVGPDTRDPPLPRPSPRPIHFTPLNPSTTSAPSGISTSVPKPFARPSAHSSEAHHRESANLPSSDQHLRNYGIKRVPAPTGDQAANNPHLQTPASQGQTAGQGFVRGTKWHPSFPPSLITYLENILRKNGSSVIGMESLMNSHGKYFCFLCKPSKRKGYIRAGSFVSHITRHWETNEAHRQT